MLMLRELVSKVDDDGESLIHISHCLGFPYSLSILNKLLLKTLKKHSMLFAIGINCADLMDFIPVD